MPTKTTIKADLEFNSIMKNLVEVLKGIAASQFASLKGLKKEKLAEFQNHFKGFFRMVDLTGSDHPLVSIQTQTIGIVVITSELGFMGALNEKLSAKALEVAGKSPAEFIVVGKKGAAKIKGQGKNVTVFPAIEESKRYERALELKDYVMKEALEKRIGKVVLVYANPVSMTTQKIEALTLIPATELFEEKEKIVIPPKQELCIESDIKDIMTYLVSVWMGHTFYETFFDSKLSEYAAQMMQLEGSLQYLDEQSGILKLAYNKKRAEDIDASMREIFSAILVKNED